MSKVNGSTEKLFQYISISWSLGSIKCLDVSLNGLGVSLNGLGVSLNGLGVSLNGLGVSLKIECPLKIECYPYLWQPLLKHHLGDATRRVDSILPIINKLMAMKKIDKIILRNPLGSRP